MGEPKRPDEPPRRPPTAANILSPQAPRIRKSTTQPGIAPSASGTANGGVGTVVDPNSTSILSPAAISALPKDLGPPPMKEPRSQGGRTKKDSHQPLEFAESQQIGRFGLIREIARGGMGQVFLARDTKLGRKVAIKFLLQNDPNFVSRFVIEARATARCTHENIVTIFEVGEHAGLPFMVLEYLEGKTLSQILEQKPSLRQFVELILPVARALERAHEHGIVHRDLKPSNIFVTDRGQVKVLDFGVAKAMGASAPGDLDKITAPVAETRAMDAVEPEVTYVTFSGGGTLVGTLPYMSPEQWGADSVDHLSDIWAVGIMFWRALTGVHPAGTMAAERLRARLCDLNSPLPSIATRDPSLPREIVAIVDRCLAKQKAQRYQSAAELASDLAAFLQPRESRGEESPYRGLAAFGEGDAKYFFGRANEIRTALGQLETWPLLAVIGPSGVGKSSFVHAGLVPAVRATSGNWDIRVLRPGRSPLASLANVLGEDDPGRVTEVLNALNDSPGAFGESLRKQASRRKQRILIVVDQLEELFTLSSDDTTRKTFLAALLAAADDPSAPVRVVLSMRADFLDRLAGHKQFLTELSRGLFFLSAPDLESLRDTLLRPAEIAGYTFESQDIVEDMLQMATSRGALPLLQFAATRMWDSRDRPRKLLTTAAYNAMGGVGGAFARHADEIAAAVPLPQQSLLRAVMTRLVTPEGTRAVIDHTELIGLSDDPADVQHIIDKLVGARLIHLHTDPTQGATVEIVHEVLIDEWPMLRRWLEDSHSLRGFMHELQTAVRQWNSRGRPADLVWSGATAQDAIGISKRHVLELSQAERDFLRAVEKKMSKVRTRRVAVVAIVMAVLGLVAVGGTVSVIRISRAERVAQEKARVADEEANKARDAKAQVQGQLDTMKKLENDRTAAENNSAEQTKVAVAATDIANKSQAELQKTVSELQNSEREAQEAKRVAEEAKRVAEGAAKSAKESAKIAEKATADAKAAQAQLEVQLRAAKARADKAEAESKKIYKGPLQ